MSKGNHYIMEVTRKQLVLKVVSDYKKQSESVKRRVYKDLDVELFFHGFANWNE